VHNWHGGEHYESANAHCGSRLTPVYNGVQRWFPDPVVNDREEKVDGAVDDRLVDVKQTNWFCRKNQRRYRVYGRYHVGINVGKSVH